MTTQGMTGDHRESLIPLPSGLDGCHQWHLGHESLDFRKGNPPAANGVLSLGQVGLSIERECSDGGYHAAYLLRRR